jgi:hypothetical protein
LYEDDVMSTRRSNLLYATVRSEGGLLPPDLLDRILRQDSALGGFEASEYGLPKATRLMAAMSQAWQAIQTHYASFRLTRSRVERDGGTGVTQTRNWVELALGELGYRELLYHAAAEQIEGRSFQISHRAGEAENAPPVHIVSFRQGIEDRTRIGGEHRSPTALLQGYLNASDHLWGVVTNGFVFRLLRENRQIDRAMRIDFDLEQMLETENFAEFQLFWLILHRSRFVQPGERRERAWLERWSKTAEAEGTRALNGLRDGVEKAIVALGQGLLEHPKNGHLVEQIRKQQLTNDQYYTELLRLVYRLLFLLVAEERRLLFPESSSNAAEERYLRHYSINRLRHEATRVRHRETHQDDLWRGLLVTFDAMRYTVEAAALGLEPLGGGLFGSGSCPHVADDAAPGTTGSDKRDGRPMLSNARLLEAIEALSEVTREGVTRWINYRDLDVEELGGVYEGLLEHRPALEARANGGYEFGFGKSTSRKETGSYYTPRSLVQELLNSALDPVIEAAIARGKTPAEQERNLLDLNICDPACGSGHFLLGAARRIGRRLAEVRAGVNREPEPGDVRHATAEAIRHCAYGVDKNPLAVDLCKVALWIESHEAGKPIGFLDHHIKRGDSLVGVFDYEDAFENGIPDGAYTAVTGDSKTVASTLRKRNRDEQTKQVKGADGMRLPMFNADLFANESPEQVVAKVSAQLDAIDAMPEDTANEVELKTANYLNLQGEYSFTLLKEACDLWTWAFFAPLTDADQQFVPTTGVIRGVITGNRPYAPMYARTHVTAYQIGFFHWRLEFPEVFRAGGFDAVLGNPPWEKVKLSEKEFFESLVPDIAQAANKAVRERLIKELPTAHPGVAVAFERAKRIAENSSLFMRASGRYPLAGKGDVNLYPIFTEHGRNAINPRGMLGIIIPDTFATNATTAEFFNDLVRTKTLHSLYGFKNERFLFEGIEHTVTYAIVTIGGTKRQAEEMEFCWLAWTIEEMKNPDRRVKLNADDLKLVNPNTLTCPIFRTARDAELTKAIYRAAPVLIDEAKGEAGNPWGVTFKTMFHMSNDSHLFHTREQLEASGAHLDSDGHFRTLTAEWLPLYEAKLIHQYDHRFASFGPDGEANDVINKHHADPEFGIVPRYWIQESEVNGAWKSARPYTLVYRAMARNTDSATFIVTLVPKVGFGNSGYLLFMQSAAERIASLLACTNSRVVEFAARQKIGGANLNKFIVEQFPILAPAQLHDEHIKLITPRVLELTYTAWDMQPFAQDLGYDGPPFVWDEERRVRLRAELDGIYAHLYGISREDFDYILDTFPIVRRKDIDQFGEYRTKRLCLEAYDHFAPETLRKLELEVREVEQELRKRVVIALDNDPERLPSDRRSELFEKRAQHLRKGESAETDSLRTLLESSYLTDLSKLIRFDGVWPTVADQFGGKRQFEDALSKLNAFRNPLAHGRSMDESVRAAGESAIAWFTDRLNLPSGA